MSDTKRLPVYLLLDCSGSMAGDAIESVRMGVKALMADLKSDPMALETVYLSVITFASSAHQVCPLTEVSKFAEPALEASGSTALGGALRLLDKSLDSEVRRAGAETKGDWKPLIFIMTDGQPTDTWEDAADTVKAKKTGGIFACAAGAGADTSVLKRITEEVFQLRDCTPGSMQKYFKWVSQTTKMKSKSVSSGAGDAAFAPPPPPPGFDPVP